MVGGYLGPPPQSINQEIKCDGPNWAYCALGKRKCATSPKQNKQSINKSITQSILQISNQSINSPTIYKSISNVNKCSLCIILGALLHLCWCAAKTPLARSTHARGIQKRMWDCNRHQGNAQNRGDGVVTPTHMVTANQIAKY